MTTAARAAGAYGATLSGSGSTIVAVGSAENAAGVEAGMAQAWRAHRVTATTFHVARPATGYEVA